MGACPSGCRSSGGLGEEDTDAAADLPVRVIADDALKPAGHEGQSPGAADSDAPQGERAREADTTDFVRTKSEEGALRMSIAAHATNHGFFVSLDTPATPADEAQLVLSEYMELHPSEAPDVDLADKLLAFKKRIILDPAFNSSHVVGCVVDDALAAATVEGRAVPQYLWEEKSVVPVLALPFDLSPQEEGVQLADATDMDRQLVDAAASSPYVCGVKVRSVIHEMSKKGITAVVNQQMEIARAAACHDLALVVEIGLSITSSSKADCEQFLLQTLLDTLDEDEHGPRVILALTLPNKPSMYQKLAYHRRVMRLLLVDGGYTTKDACTMLGDNLVASALFRRAVKEGLVESMTPERFSAAFAESCGRVAACCRDGLAKAQQKAKLTHQDGVIVVFDEAAIVSGEALEQYGHRAPEGGWTGREVLGKASQAIWRIVLDKAFTSSKIAGAEVHESVIRGTLNGRLLVDHLWNDRKVVPMLLLGRVHDQGGTRQDFSEVLTEAQEMGFLGVSLVSRIDTPVKANVKAAVEELFGMASTIRSFDLVPMLHLLAARDSPKKTEIELLLLDELLNAVGNLKPGEKVLLSLTVPTEPNLYLPLVEQRSVLRIAARARSIARKDACAQLSRCYGITSGFGRAAIEDLRLCQSAGEFSQALAGSISQLYEAATAVPTKEIQLAKVTASDGTFVALDHGGQAAKEVLRKYGIGEDLMHDAKAVQSLSHRMRQRVLSNQAFSGTRILAATVTPAMLSLQIGGRPLAKYAWEVKRIVPFLTLDNGLHDERDGVQLFTETKGQATEKVLEKARDAGIFGVKARSVILSANDGGISKVVKQQLKFAKTVFRKDLVPVIQIEVSIKSEDKLRCEQLLLVKLLEGLKTMAGTDRLVLWLTLPEKPNAYMPLLAHPNVIRIAALSGGYDHKEACRRLSQNAGLIAGFGRAVLQGLAVGQLELEFQKALARACKEMFKYSQALGTREMQLARCISQDGLFAALDSSGPNLVKLMQAYGFLSTDEASVEMEAHKLRTRILLNPTFNGSRVIACVLPADMMAKPVGGRMLPAKYLWEVKRIVPFLRVDGGGLLPEENGVRLLSSMDKVKADIHKADAFGCLGLKARSLIKSNNQGGIKAVVAQQMQFAKLALAAGLVPILQIEVDPSAEDKAACEAYMRQALVQSLRDLGDSDRVILQVALPTKPNSFAGLASLPKILRAVALSGGSGITEACKQLSKNPGFIGAFGRALTQGLHREQTENQFTKALDEAVDTIFLSSLAAQLEATERRENERKESPAKTGKLEKRDSVARGELEEAALGA